MCRKVFHIIPLFFGIAVLLCTLAGCQNTVNTGEEVTLRVGQSVQIEGKDLKITFVGISNDSRCPTGATCVWAGEVSCDVEIRHGGKISFVKFVYPGAADGYSQLTYKGYTYSFKVEPYPEADKAIPPGKYRLFLIVD
jgi:hypothetical protein